MGKYLARRCYAEDCFYSSPATLSGDHIPALQASIASGDAFQVVRLFKMGAAPALILRMMPCREEHEEAATLWTGKRTFLSGGESSHLYPIRLIPVTTRASAREGFTRTRARTAYLAAFSLAHRIRRQCEVFPYFSGTPLFQLRAPAVLGTLALPSGVRCRSRGEPAMEWRGPGHRCKYLALAGGRIFAHEG